MPATSTVSDTLESAWAAVEQDLGTASGRYARRIFKQSGLAIFVSLDEPTRQRCFSFEVLAASVKGLRLVQSARGFDVMVDRVANAAGTSVTRVSVGLTTRAFSDLFSVLAADVVGRVIDIKSEPDAMRLLHSRLEHWRRFAEAVGPEGLDPKEQTGLFGELMFLNTLLDFGMPTNEVVSSWHGPLRDNQDFCFGTTAIEVKGSTSNTPNLVTISNEWQLDSTGLDALFLFHISLERRTGAGTFLPDMIGAIAKRLHASDSAAEALFEDRLFAQGYLPSQADIYRDVGFTERRRDLYEVAAEFPKITGSVLPTGVGRVRYELNLATATGFKTTMRQFFSSISS